MNTTSELAEAFRSALENPTRGVVGVVDDLLRLCPEQGLRLEWQGDGCRMWFLNGGSEEGTEVSLPRSAFRAMLARIAVLCNERRPNSVSPYGGKGELSIGANPPAALRVSFANTAAEQKLELMPETALPADDSA
ncbi:MAG TPA: hypothetical protein VMS17_09110 [Gemmataceae bacterium]|nr:hypothetical protein [Gemmataceae bacterium]